METLYSWTFVLLGLTSFFSTFDKAFAQVISREPFYLREPPGNTDGGRGGGVGSAAAGPSSQAKLNAREREKQVLDKILAPAHYDKRIRPAGVNNSDGPVLVRINVMFRNIVSISDIQMDYAVQLTFREEWSDERLKYNEQHLGRVKYLTVADPQKIWMPDLFFTNEKKGHFHNIIVPNVYVRIFPNGQVLYSIRLSLLLSCPMNLQLFPLDRQTCQLRMTSYGWTTDDLVFLWREGDPVQVNKNMQLPRFTLQQFATDYCTQTTNTGGYSCLLVDLQFKREFSYYLIQIYIPCCMLVIVSWVSFWLDANAVPARVSLGVTTLLTMATQTTAINNSLPPVSYTKAIDVWTGVCLTFVFGALLEFALVNYASRSDAHREKLKKHRRQWEIEHQAALETEALLEQERNNFPMQKPLMRPTRAEGCLLEQDHCDLHVRNAGAMATTSHATRSPRQRCTSWLGQFQLRSKRIDVISRIIFPFVFALFNVVYWVTYLTQESKT